MLRAEVRLAWKTQAGHRHHVEGLGNEDAVFVTEEHPLFDAVLMVADGMGGHPRPQEASEQAVRAAREFLFDRTRVAQAGDLLRALAGAVRAGHQAVRTLRNGAGSKNPGTTLSLAAVAEGVLHLAHVGDGSVILMRAGQARVLAGGEERRAGNRPEQFLGQDDALEPEQRQVPLVEGDRLLLCTDGLTRYFGEAGPEALERVLGRQGVEIQVVASQLTAHSRPGDYDDDTTVALAEVVAVREAPREPPVPKPKTEPALEEGREKGADPGRKRAAASAGSLLLQVAAAGVVVAGALAVGFAAGRFTAPRPPQGGTNAPQAEVRAPVPPEELKRLPPGNVVLVDQLGNRLFALSTRNGRPGVEPVKLDAYRILANGQVELAGRFVLDPRKAELTDADGHVYPVETDYSRGAIRILRGATIAVNTRPPGAAVYLDGRLMGPAPQKLRLPTGRHRIRARGRNWVSGEQEVNVLGGESLSLTLQKQ